jgi:hypothetical protein
VTAVVKAWDDNSVSVKSVTDDILHCLFVHCLGPIRDVLLTNCRFHPDFQNHASQIQREMLACVRNWLQSLGHKQSAVLARLSKEAVRNHQNVRLGGEGASVSQSHGAVTGNAGFPGQGNLQGIPGMGQVQGLYNQFSGGAGAGREGGFGTAMGTVPAPEIAPPPVPVSPRPGGGQAAGFFGNSPTPFASQSYMPPPAYPGGPAVGLQPLPQTPSPRPAHASGPYHGHGHGYPSPAQPGFPGGPDQPPYSPSASGFPDSGSQSPYIGAPPLVPPQGPSYPGSSYPGQSLYPGQQGTGYLGMPNSDGRFSPSYDSPPNPPPSFPGTAPSFPQSGPGFPNAPNAQSGSGYGYGNYGQGPY